MRLAPHIWIPLLLLLLAAAPAPARDSGTWSRVSVPEVEDLQRDGLLSHQRQLPIMVVFSAHDCGFCVLLEEEFLKPMLISGEYDDRVIIRTLNIDGVETIRDFAGEHVDPYQFAKGEGIFVTPTIKFFDGDGNELAPRMIGINTVEMYGWYLDNAIASSLDMLAAGTP